MISWLILIIKNSNKQSQGLDLLFKMKCWNLLITEIIYFISEITESQQGKLHIENDNWNSVIIFKNSYVQCI